jgi:carboxyl-terminal processing protease
VLVIGTILGLTVSIGSSMLADREAHRAALAATEQPGDYMELLTEVMDRVRREYVDSIDEKTLVEAAIRGIVETLDTHSRFLDSEQYEDIRISTTGNYSGVGLDVSLDDGQVTVVAPLDDAPAARAGILAGDVVVSVDDIPVDDDNVEDTINRMRGQPGTEVRLGVTRAGEDDLLRFSLLRAEIHVDTVRSEYLGNGYGYIRLNGFSDATAAELEAAAESLHHAAADGLRGLVLDLRNNPGGVLGAAIAVADQFLDDGLIVRGNGRVRQARFEQYASPGDPLEDVRLAVLVNAGSASGSEIVAGAIKDHHRGKLVGERTYGKGSVQSVMPLGEGTALKLTTARYLTPSGRSINGTGIEPDVVVRARDPNLQYRGPGSTLGIADDEQLSRALELVGYEPIALSQAL